jgi:hypothetical protein
VQLGAGQDRLRAAGVEILAIINTTVERARLYFKYRPMRVLLLADPEAMTHRTYGLPKVEIVAAEAAGVGSQWPLKTTLDDFLAVRINPTGELPESMNPVEAMAAVNQKEGFQLTEVDKEIAAAHGTWLPGHFLIDQGGVIRWSHIEAKDRMTDIGKFPSEEELLAAARTLSS